MLDCLFAIAMYRFYTNVLFGSRWELLQSPAACRERGGGEGGGRITSETSNQDLTSLFLFLTGPV